MSTRKAFEEDKEDADDEENEHARLMKEQEKYENESIQAMPNLNDEEYAHIIEMSESLGRGDAKMDDLDICDDEEKRSQNNQAEIAGRHQPNESDNEESYESHNEKSFAKRRSGFNDYVNPYKKQVSPTSSLLRKTALTRDTEPSNKFQNYQRYSSMIPFDHSSGSSSRTPLSQQRDINEEIRKEVVQLVKVRVEELQSKMKSKSDMFYVLRHMCGYHLPEYDDCPIQFMRDILTGSKKAIKIENVRLIAVPFYDSLSIRQNWHDIKQLYPEIIQYFPDYDPEYMPSRKFFWEIFASLHYEDAKTIINNERKRKYEKEANEKAKEIVIDKDVLNLIQGSLYFSKKKGRALYNIKPKDYGVNPQRKRKTFDNDDYEGNSHEISVFNKDRCSKRFKNADIDSTSTTNVSMKNRINPFASPNPFKKSYKPSSSISPQDD